MNRRPPALFLSALLALGTAGTLAGTAAAAAPGAAAAAGCDPTTTPAHHLGAVPSPSSVLGFPLGERAATNAQIRRYLTVADRASNRVVTGTFARSWEGRPLPYALVGRAATLAPARLSRLQRDISALRDPATPAAEAAAIARRSPTILWVSANVHGNEPSGADAVLEVLYDLADRSDCAADRILDNALVGLVPVQNPDGRAHDVRTNAYAFDMNRDWFTRTQPEVRGKLDLLWRFPPQLFIDEHEMGGTGYYFPPNADPVYHETPAQALRWMDTIYGDANKRAFREKGYPFQTFQAGYDLLYQGYGDSVPTTELGAAGMTYEQGYYSPYPVKVARQYTSAWASLYAGAAHREAILTGYHREYVNAQAQGEACKLSPNRVYNPGHTVEFQVPDRPVCGYFLRAATDDASRRNLRKVLNRLLASHVRVRQLTAALQVPDFRPYGRAPRAATLPAGSYWIPMAQAQKHWVQAMLNEDTYVPFPYFYDVSAWSLPLLGDTPGGYTGTNLQPASRALHAAPPAPPVQVPGRAPRIGVVDDSSTAGYPSESAGWLRWRMSQDWHVPYSVLSPADVTAARLAKLDVLVVPNVGSDDVASAMGAAGQEAVRRWVRGGGRYLGWQGGTQLAAGLGLTTVRLADPTSQVPGSLFRVQAEQSALTSGTGRTTYVMYAGDPVMSAGPGGRVVVGYPQQDSPEWFVSGYAEGAGELAGTATEVSERYGQGQTVLLSVEPNFRGFTDGSAQLVLDAALAPQVAGRAAADTPALVAARRLAAADAARLTDLRPDRLKLTSRMVDPARR